MGGGAGRRQAVSGRVGCRSIILKCACPVSFRHSHSPHLPTAFTRQFDLRKAAPAAGLAAGDAMRLELRLETSAYPRNNMRVCPRAHGFPSFSGSASEDECAA